MLNDAPTKPSLAKLAVVAFIFVGVAIYLMIAGTRGDLLWFNPSIDTTPREVKIYRYGLVKTLQPGANGFADIVKVVQEEVVKVNSLPDGGVSPDTIADVRGKQLAVELIYPKQITIHSTFALGTPDTILVPLSGWEADKRYYYLAANGTFGAWLPTLPPGSHERIKSMVESYGY